ncbi:Shootin-1 [Myotis davidii]|uniref:Shootin-1 n=1 Tax=Myotis davidii TaxID=225400 RepID=L5MDQ3_MYODS|nr:Shootin-1 [Myotis davidii]
MWEGGHRDASQMQICSKLLCCLNLVRGFRDFDSRIKFHFLSVVYTAVANWSPADHWWSVRYLKREENKSLTILTELILAAIGEYEDLRAENQKTKEKCDKIRQERDEAVRKLEEFEKISHMVIEEVNFMQNHLEIEKTCRESAEALATKLNKENKTLKRISMLYMAKLGPDVITEEINIDDEEPTTDPEATADPCVSVQCQKQIKVSMLAVEEYEEMQVNLELEKDLRKKAESFAQEMFIEQNKLKRQSHLLLQSSVPDQQLLKALDENAKLTQLLEGERIQHQQKVKELEEQLESEALHKEIHNLKQQLELLEEDKKELELKYQNSEEKARNLKHSVDELQKRVNQSENSVPPPPPPPPPLPPPPPNPIRSLMSMIRKRSHTSGSGAIHVFNNPHASEEVTDLKRQAVEEMMDRIKKGVHLRPVNQAARPKAQPESPKGSESAVNELKGILGTLNKSTSSRSLKSLHTESSESELERILRRRKVTAEAGSSSPTGILATSESKSMPVLGSVSSVAKTALNKKTLEAEFSSPAPEPGEGPCKLEGGASPKVTFQPPSDPGWRRQYIGSENKAEPVVVLDPVSTHEPQTKDQGTEQDPTPCRDDDGEIKTEYKEDSAEKMRDTDSSSC